MKIPNAERAVVDIRKLRDYCLNPDHDTGKHKARLFAALLGMGSNDAKALRNALLEAVKTHEARLGQRDRRGQRYTIDFIFDWHGKQAKIRSGWIIQPNSNSPRLITAYPLKGRNRL